jgi:3-deoxy-D-arabino-heptulosonate 7-phosphate (DAHP) synthase class II
MEPSNELRQLSEAELEAVNGGLISGFGVQADQRLALQQRLTEAYAKSNPYDFYGYFG